MTKKLLLATSLIVAAVFSRHANAQNAPTFTSTPVTTGTENVIYTYSVTATDPNNDPLTFTSVNTLPSWLSLSTSGTSSATAVGTLPSATYQGVAIDNAGNTYVAQNNGTNVYKITPDGTTTLFKTGRPSGTVYNLSFDDHYLYILNYSASNISRIDVNDNTLTETTVLTGFTSPYAAVFRAGNMYVSSSATNKVIKVAVSSLPTSYSSGTMDYITTGLSLPDGMDFDQSGNLFIANKSLSKISKYNGTTLSDHITGIGQNNDVKIDNNGNLYAALQTGSILKYAVGTTTSPVTITVGGSGAIWGMAINPGGTLVFARGNSVYKYETGAVLSGTPTHADVGTYPITLRVSDGTNTSDQVFNIVITDPNPPTLSSRTPTINATSIPVNTNIGLTFNEDVKKGNGNITIKKVTDNSIVETIDVTSSRVTVSNTTVTIDPVGNIPALTEVYVQIDATAITDIYNNAYAGILNSSWSFQTAAKLNQTISWASPTATLTYGTADFAAATSDNNSIPITYQSSDPTVATVTANTIHILKTGTTTFTASQAGDAGYNAAADQTFTLTVTPKALTVSLNTSPAITKVYNNSAAATLAAGNYTLNGVVGSDVVTVSGTATYDTKNAGTGKTITATGFVLAGSAKDNYTLTTTSATTTGSVTAKPITVALTPTPAVTKVYDGTISATLVAGNYTLNGTELGDVVTVSGTATYDTKNAGTGKAITANSFVLAGASKDNYSLANTSASTTATITSKALTVTAADKTRLQGLANPPFTLTYSGFIAGEDAAVLTTAPSASTTATTTSLPGTYPITVSGGVAVNYSFNYVNGILTVIPGAPTSISLAAATLYENQPSGTLAGTLSSISDDPTATFTYSLVGGTGDADNSLFTIVGNELRTSASLDFELKSTYSVVVRSATATGGALDRQFTITIGDVNEAPTLNAVTLAPFCFVGTAQTISMSGITSGPENAQTITVSVSSNNSALFSALSVSALSGSNATLNYALASAGTAIVTITVKDNGGTANGGSDTFTRTFTLTANPIPVVSINSSLGASISKGDIAILTASGGTTYSWANAAGIISGQNSATLSIRPTATTTYTVTVSNSSGCSVVQNFVVTVKEDYKVDANNVMSPDGDGKNDNLVIKNLDMYPNNEVTVFDRAGRLLYQKKNYTNDWNGTFQNSPLADGTYYYVVDFGPGKGRLKGYVTIVRNK